MNRRLFLVLLSGATLAQATPTRAQRPSMVTIGYLSGGSLDSDGPRTAAFRDGLKEAGFIEGQNITIEYR